MYFVHFIVVNTIMSSKYGSEVFFVNKLVVNKLPECSIRSLIMCRKCRNFKKDCNQSVVLNIVINTGSEEVKKLVKQLQENNLVPVDEAGRDSLVIKSKL